MKYVIGVSIFNFFAAAVCLVAFVVDVILGSWTVACLQLALFSVNFYMGYINYQRYKYLKGLQNDGN